MRWLPIDPASWSTLRARLTIWNTAVVLLMSAATLVAFWFGGRAALYREADAVIRGNVREVAIAIADLHPDIDAVVDEMRRKAAGHEDRGWFTQLLTEDGITLWKSPRCPAEVSDFPPTPSDTRENIVQVGPYRYVRVAIARPEQPPLHVRIGMSTEFLDDNIEALMRLLIPVGVLLSLLTPLAGYWLAVRATQPVADILHTAERLRPTRLGDRLPEQGSADELDRLSRQINRLLDQVAAHVDRQEQFVADAAHELRGPLAAIQSALEVAMAQDRSADEQRETLADVLEATRHLSKVANDLLLLAETSDATAAQRREAVDLARVAGQAVGMFAGVAEERGIQLELETGSPPAVSGDAARLRQVVGNLLDNALRFTPPGGRVAVRVVAAGGDGLLTVRDTGPGIAAVELERIFDRFYKADPARTHATSSRSGGLGLAICKSLVEASGGSITIASRPGEGTEVCVRLPVWRAAEAAGQPAGSAGPAEAAA
jgi:two-component system heavy metal sensor histidine kinase CusS